MAKYPLPRIKGYHKVWSGRSLDKLVDLTLVAEAHGFKQTSVGVPGRYALYIANESLLAAEAKGLIHA